MPFVADVGMRDEPWGAIWRPFAIIRDNIEQLVTLNLAWSVQLIPGILALAFPQWPLWLRVVLGLYSATAVIPATGVLYALTLAACRGEQLSRDLAIESLRELALPSLRLLTPLFGAFGILIWSALLVEPNAPFVTTLATVVGLLWYLCATYWGPLLVSQPGASIAVVAGRSTELVWRYPAQTCVTALVATIALLVGLISIGGVLLIVPVVVALLHCQRYLDLAGRDGSMPSRE
jgi:hypothetical protein